MSDIDIINRTVHLFGKGRKHRDNYLSAKAVVAIEDYLKERGKDNCEYLIVSKRKPINKINTNAYRKIIKRLMINVPEIQKNVTPHIFRHTTATTALRSGMPIEEVSKMLGHESTDTTLIYAEVSNLDVKRDHEKYIS